MSKFDKGIPVPKKSRKPNGYWDFLNEMEVGDSYLDKEATKADQSCKAYNTLLVKAKGKGWEVKARQVDGGVRVWRVK